MKLSLVRTPASSKMGYGFAWNPSWNLSGISYIDRALAPVAPAKSYLAALGAIYLGVKAGQAAICLGRGFVSYFLARPLNLAVDLRKVGEWAGEVSICFHNNLLFL